MEDNLYETLKRCYESVRSKTDFKPELGIVLGSGLGHFANKINVNTIIDYGDIQGFPVSTVPGHSGKLIMGFLEDVPVVVMVGRVHYYEGYAMDQVVTPVRLMAMLGIKTIVLTNAAGGINEGFRKGSLMMITDHISSFVPNCLIGSNMEFMGPRFPDMTNVYDIYLQKKMKIAADRISINLCQGVYVQLTGPSFETPTEIKMLRMLGADAVGMSTVCEAIACAHAGVKVCALSCITNMAAGIEQQVQSFDDVKETANTVADIVADLLVEYVKVLKEAP